MCNFSHSFRPIHQQDPKRTWHFVKISRFIASLFCVMCVFLCALCTGVCGYVCVCVYVWTIDFYGSNCYSKSKQHSKLFQKTISTNAPHFGLLASQPLSLTPNATMIEVYINNNN